MSSNLSMISRLIAEVRESQTFRNLAKETAAQRFLAQDVEKNHTVEAELRKRLAAYLDEWETKQESLLPRGGRQAAGAKARAKGS
ncbi:hypothetical protein M2281_002463 [Mesorhizobium soli]|uniref:hypothetical protein n=1 Tax=Pseudaminobacter soli (ex Li et al. 2025) TaxID=1295366 RepID=UPI0024740340|nr:hypothetical protein [Mesorhizobium soli]MDH6231865.1 hypothetical protein [Mesorhizobium soli]